MQKLVNAYIANPSQANADRILKHNDKYPFSGILLMPEHQALIARILVNSI